jgi:apolipoprotein N-acyltransferase
VKTLSKTKEFWLSKFSTAILETGRKQLLWLSLAIGTGLLLAFAFSFPNYSFLIWLSLVPLFFTLERVNFKQAFLIGWLAGLVFFGLLLSWIAVFGITAWLFLIFYQALFLGFFCLLALSVFQKANLFFQPLFVASVWVAVEVVRASGKWGFGWGLLGSAINNLKIIQAASVIGEFGLSFLIVLANFFLFRAIKGLLEREKKSWLIFSGLLALLLVITYLGGQLLLLQKKIGKKVKVSVIQGNIPQDIKFEQESMELTKQHYLTLTERALQQGAKLVIWPETAYPEFILNDQAYLEKLKQLAASYRSDLVIGTFDRRKNRIYNSLLFLAKDKREKIYYKIHLVPFGEFVPFKSVALFFNKLVALVRELAPGSKYVIFPTQVGSLAGVICFESADSLLNRKFIQEGARLMVVATNDAWFDQTAAPEQHFKITRIRAVENGVYYIQAANTGVSGIIDAHGRVLARSELNKRQIIAGRAVFARQVSFYSKYGLFVDLIYFFVAIIGAVYSFKSSRKESEKLLCV